MSRVIPLGREVRDSTSPVHRFLVEAFPHVKPIAEDFRKRIEGKTTLLPPGGSATYPWSTIGLAIDYRIRFYFRITYLLKLGAYQGTKYMQSNPAWGDNVPVPIVPGLPAETACRYIPRLANDVFTRYEAVITEIDPVKRELDAQQEMVMCRYCVVLALFEEVARNVGSWDTGPLASLKEGSRVDDVLALAHPDWVTDCVCLSQAFYRAYHSLLHQKVYVNPDLTENGSLAGAEPDLLINGCVVDIKTTRTPSLPAAWLHQVLAYVLLDSAHSWTIGGVGFYLTRQVALAQWGLKSLLPTVTGSAHVSLETLRREFRQVLLDRKFAP